MLLFREKNSINKNIKKLNRQIYLKKISPLNLFNFYENLSTIIKLCMEKDGKQHKKVKTSKG